MITAVHHIALIVSSEDCLEFYRLLGFREIFRKVREYDVVVLMENNGLQLELFIDPRHDKRTGAEPIGLRHFALKVDEKLEDVLEKLQRDSVRPFEHEPIQTDWVGQRYCFLKDYDGIRIELHE